jgi:ribulose 1,5-bisphosphate carboxylase large subunit-like protein
MSAYRQAFCQEMRTILAHSLLTETSKIYMISISVDIEELDTRAKVIHELPQCA